MAQTRWLTDALADREVVVELVARNGDQTTRGPARIGRVTLIEDKSFLLLEAPARTYRVPFEYTHSLSTINRKKGAIDGMLVGGLLGGVAGAVFGAVASRLGCDQDFDPPHCPGYAPTAVPGVAGAFLGGALGAGIGPHRSSPVLHVLTTEGAFRDVR